MSNGPWGPKNTGGAGSGSGGGSGGNSGGGLNNPWRSGGSKGGGAGGKSPRPGGGDPLEDRLSRMQKDFREKLNLDGNPGRGITLALLVFGVLWMASGFYKVNPNELGVVQRFGKYEGITPPGLRYHLPYPVETVTTLGVLNINTVEVGFRSSGGRYGASEDQMRHERQMLTGDQNVIEISFDVQWKIDETHPQNFLFNVRDPEGTLQPVAESAMREVIGKLPITSALAKQADKLKIETDARALIQATLDNYKAGIRIERVNLLKADPPAGVIDAFRDVKTAEQDKETAQNRARTYANGVVPEARGEAQRILQEAEGYKSAIVAEAQGNAQRFRAIADQYHNAPDSTAKRLYIETMESVLKDMPKVILDGKGAGNAVPVLPLPAMQPPAPPRGEAQDEPALRRAEPGRTTNRTDGDAR